MKLRLIPIAVTAALMTACVSDLPSEPAQAPDANTRDGNTQDVRGYDVASPDVGGDRGDATSSDRETWHVASHAKRRWVSWGELPFEPLTDFTLPVRFEESLGQDIEARRSDGTKVAVEARGDHLWALIPTLDGSDGFWVYYEGSRVESEAAWAGHYQLVWHLDQDSDDSSGSFNATALPVGFDAGRWGSAAVMQDGLRLRNALVPVARPVSSGDWTVEFWADLRGMRSQTSTNLVFGKLDVERDQVTVRWGDPRQLILQAQAGGQNTNRKIAWPTSGGFHHVAVVFSEADRTATLYLNGVPEEKVVVSDPTWTPTDQEFAVGGEWQGGGLLDEVRVSNVALSRDWLSAIVYTAQPGFMTVGSAQSR
jgi:hypothetical protein